MTPLRIAGVGVCASGMPTWAAARAILRGESPWQPTEPGKIDVPLLPVTERRRTNQVSRYAISAAVEAIADFPQARVPELASVFAAADGDGQVLASTLQALADDAASMSPTLFHNSVFNAPAGYWSIASRSRGASITVSAGTVSFAAGLLEAAIEVSTGSRAVLLVAADLPFPPELASFGVTGEAFACALLLLGEGSDGTHGTIEVSLRANAAAVSDAEDRVSVAAHFAGNSAAAALPLLACVARATAAASSLPYLDDGCVEIAYRP